MINLKLDRGERSQEQSSTQRTWRVTFNDGGTGLDVTAEEMCVTDSDGIEFWTNSALVSTVAPGIWRTVVAQPES